MREKNNDQRRIPTDLLAYILTLIVKELKINVEHGRVVTTLNNQTLNILFSVLTKLLLGKAQAKPNWVWFCNHIVSVPRHPMSQDMVSIT